MSERFWEAFTERKNIYGFAIFEMPKITPEPGFRVIEDPWLPTNDVYLIHEQALENLIVKEPLPPLADHRDPYSMDFDSITFKIRQEFAIGSAVGYRRAAKPPTGMPWPGNSGRVNVAKEARWQGY